FPRIICDEGHSVKTIVSLQHWIVLFMGAYIVWVLTATPMWNQVMDIVGYL
ncbi:hypothetical protein BO71DRAFT_297631, partial [Aspergillus ellipticus CBS 707.79]